MKQLCVMFENLMKSISILIIIAMFSSCGDLLTPTKKISGPYYLSEDENGMSWSHYYDLNASGIGRIDSVNRIGWTDKYIFAEKESNYFFLDKTKDNQYFNSSDIVKGPFNYDTFHRMLDSLKLKEFEFQIYLDK